jgi:AcrR family transcriptional regulator
LRDERAHATVVLELRRSHLLDAALREVAERGWRETPVAAIVACARVSRKTFYELFDSRDECLVALFDESLARIERVVAPAYASARSWPERVRAALVALLAFLEVELDRGSFVLGQITTDGPIDSERRARVLEPLRAVVDEGRSHPQAREQLSPLAAEVVVAGVLSVIDARLRRGLRKLTPLVNPLMWTIVLPYLGPTAAARELRRRPPRPASARAKPARSPLEGLDMRVTYRTARVLAALVERPGASNVEIAAQAQVGDAGQISKLLARLRRLGLIENTEGRATGAANAWRLTPRGEEVAAAITRRFATVGNRAGGRGDA